VESLTLAGQAAYTPGASLVLNLAATLTADASQTEGLTLAVLGSVPLVALTGLAVDSQAEFVADTALDVTAAIAAATQQVMEAWVSLGASAATAQSASAAYSAAVTLQAQAVLTAATTVGGVMADFLVSVVEALLVTNSVQCLAPVLSVAALSDSDNTVEAIA
jgi:hypothetical protein